MNQDADVFPITDGCAPRAMLEALEAAVEASLEDPVRLTDPDMDAIGA